MHRRLRRTWTDHRRFHGSDGFGEWKSTCQSIAEGLRREGYSDDVVRASECTLRQVVGAAYKQGLPGVVIDDIQSMMLARLGNVLAETELRGKTAGVFLAEHLKGARSDALREADPLCRGHRKLLRLFLEVCRLINAVHGREVESDELARIMNIPIETVHRLHLLAYRAARVNLDKIVHEDSDESGHDRVSTFLRSNADGFLAYRGVSRLPEDIIAEREGRRILIESLLEIHPDTASLGDGGRRSSSTIFWSYHLHGMRLREIGAAMGVTEARACQLKAIAVRQVRDRLGIPGLEDTSSSHCNEDANRDISEPAERRFFLMSQPILLKKLIEAKDRLREELEKTVRVTVSEQKGGDGRGKRVSAPIDAGLTVNVKPSAKTQPSHTEAHAIDRRNGQCLQQTAVHSRGFSSGSVSHSPGFSPSSMSTTTQDAKPVTKPGSPNPKKRTRITWSDDMWEELRSMCERRSPSYENYSWADMAAVLNTFPLEERGAELKPHHVYSAARRFGFI